MPTASETSYQQQQGGASCTCPPPACCSGIHCPVHCLPEWQTLYDVAMPPLAQDSMRGPVARSGLLRARTQGLSTELGAFIAGVMLSATEQQENALGQLQHVAQFFVALFICSTGLVMSPTFLAQHLRVLAGGLVVTVLAKTVLVGCPRA